MAPAQAVPVDQGEAGAVELGKGGAERGGVEHLLDLAEGVEIGLVEEVGIAPQALP